MASIGIHVVEPAGAPDRDLLTGNILDLERRGFAVTHTPTPPDHGWCYSSGGADDRCGALSAALTDADCDYVIAARGGYGASDLLPLLNWDVLSTAPPRCLVGLSDISALHVCIHERLGWRGLHAVMPGGTLWRPGSEHTEHLLGLLARGPPWRESLAVVPVDGQRSRRPVEGTLLGGCLSVLTGLIGTPYAPSSWEGSILFIEDINENPGRLMRFWTQWAQSGALAGLRALVVGQLAGVSDRDEVLSQFVRRSAVPVYSCELFGHQAPSFALGQGARARISDSELQWEIDRF